MRHKEYNSDVWLPGDKENEHLGDDRGTLVGDGTPYVVVSATIEMVPLDAEAEGMLAAEEKRLVANSASMNPVDQLPVIMEALLKRDDYESKYIPGFPGIARPQPQPRKVP